MTQPRRRQTSSLLACLACSLWVACAPAGDAGSDDGGDDTNEPPVARLVGPQLASVGHAATFDASGSDDTDGAVIVIRLLLSNGAPLVESVKSVGSVDGGSFDHIFEAAGRVIVRIEVEDDNGATAEAEIDVVVVDGDVEGCSCDAHCLDDGVCANSTRLLRATSADEVPPAVEGALACP